MYLVVSVMFSSWRPHGLATWAPLSARFQTKLLGSLPFPPQGIFISLSLGNHFLVNLGFRIGKFFQPLNKPHSMMLHQPLNETAASITAALMKVIYLLFCDSLSLVFFNDDVPRSGFPTGICKVELNL